MKDVMQYKNFIGSVHFNADDEIFYGKIEGINNDLVTFEGESVKKLKKAFEEAVEDYLQLCEQVGKPALKSYKGSFNVRIPQELHRRTVQKALMSGISLNQLIQKALEKEVSQ
jgi:predicted HicB family RNase H-like nuclease